MTAVGGLTLAPVSAHADAAGHVILNSAVTTWTVPAGVAGAVFTLAGGARGSETTSLDGRGDEGADDDPTRQEIPR